MSAHLFSSPFFNSITRLSLCLVLLVAFGQVPVVPRSPSPVQGNGADLAPQQSVAGLALSDWRAILRVMQDAEAPSAWSSPPGAAPLPGGWAPGSLQSLAFDQWTQHVRISPADANPSLAFGYSVAIDGDTLVVGAYWDHHLETGGGSAYVFIKPAAGWSAVTQAAKLYPSDPGFHEYFGWSVAISGDTIVVGCPYDSTPYGASSHGSAYVFVRPDAGWAGELTETAKLLASDKATSDQFARKVAIDGNVIVIGVPFDDVGANDDQGSAYVFTRPGSGWANATETAKLTASNGVAGNMFGAAVAISGSTVAVGAYGRNNGLGVGEGMVYIFGASGDWVSGTENARLTASDAADHEYFGWSVGIDGDLVVVGAPGEGTFDHSGEEAAYIFVRPVAGWAGDLTENAMLTASDGAIDDDFGDTIAVDGDVVVVGAPLDDVGSQVKQGSAYVFKKPAGSWANSTETDKLVAADGVNSDEFGTSVSVSGTTIVAGAPRDNVVTTGDHIGSAYIYGSLKYIYLPVTLR